MFTGIIETVGTVIEIGKEKGSTHFCLKSSISNNLKPGQSVSHDGICLTVTKIDGDSHWVTAVRETLSKSTFNSCKVGQEINLERSMPGDGRFDGHIVQGHVDQRATCVAIRKDLGSWLMDFTYDPATKNITIEKGSVAINGVSLTCFNSGNDRFTVAVIPYTFEHTNFRTLQTGTPVNLEFDILGKYVQRLMP